MNKWFKLALNSFIAIIVLNLFLGVLFSGLGIGFVSLGGLLVLATKIMYILLVVGLTVGLIVAAKEFLTSK